MIATFGRSWLRQTCTHCVTVGDRALSAHNSCGAPAYRRGALCRNLSGGGAFYDNLWLYCSDEVAWFSICVFLVCSYCPRTKSSIWTAVCGWTSGATHSNSSFQFARQRRLKPKLSTVSWYSSLLLYESVFEPILLIKHVSHLRYTFIFCYRLQKFTSLFRYCFFEQVQCNNVDFVTGTTDLRQRFETRRCHDKATTPMLQQVWGFSLT